MGVLEIRQEILNQLDYIEDISFLKAIKSLVESKAKDGVYILSDEQKERIYQARLQFLNNETIDNQIVEEEIELWLKSK
ncbi:MAG: hypothetical protein KKG25_08965 [Bacteroidetes bacterium]|nr:hypothetical protein [Bacteroidota bacterium]MBU1484968.1 hypothetical protein [Bacteroidota bacterium]MBU1761231.1 hypothetical protein [Bacteroidota bacterium]MBU2266679.1 hypothetical protein [Bacteroidota bacterium]MBU2374879.1 hypothetical protein [Bacteroidota bacterium]